MSDSSVFKPGQSLRRREMMRAAAAGTVAFGMGTASTGSASALDPTGITTGQFAAQGLRTLYSWVSAYGDDGYTQESVHDMSAENYHLRVWQGIDASHRTVEGALTTLENFVVPSDPTSSPLAEMAFSVLRTTALTALQEGKSVTDARIEAENAALEELAIPYRNVCHQWNELVYDCVRYLFAYYDSEDVEWDGDSDEIEHEAGDTLEGFTLPSSPTADQDVIDGLPSWLTAIYYRPDDWSLSNISVSIRELTDPTGDTVETYQFEMNLTTGTSAHIERTSWPTASDSRTIDIRASDPSGGSREICGPDLGFPSILNAIDSIANEIQSEGGDAVEEIMQAYDAGDVSEMDVLSSYDLVREYGDSDEMTRYTAEMLAAGLDAQDDVTHLATIDHPDTGERTGRLFLSWDWSELRSWEYDYDPQANTIEIDPASLDDDPELTVVFDDDGTETEIDLTAADLEDGFADFEQDYGLLVRVERHSQGELRSHIPVGEETDHWTNATFIYDDGDGGADQVWLDSNEPFELVAVEDEDGTDLEKLELNGWENQERDPALSLREAERAEEQFVTVADLEETAHGGGGGGGGGTNTNALLLGGGIIALIGMIIAALSGDS